MAVLALVVASPWGVQTALAQELGNLLALDPPGDRAELRARLTRQAPAGSTTAELQAFHRDRYHAAVALFDWAAAQRVLREWMRDTPGDDFLPRWYLWGVLVATNTDWDEGLRLGEGVLRDSKLRDQKARIAAQLAVNYRQAGRRERSEQLLNEAEALLAEHESMAASAASAASITSGAASDRAGGGHHSGRRGGGGGGGRGAAKDSAARSAGAVGLPAPGDAFQHLFALQAIASARCGDALGRERVERALAHCSDAEESARRLVAEGSKQPGPPLVDARVTHFYTVMGLAHAQLRAGRAFDAEESARRALDLAAAYRLAALARYNAYGFLAGARLARHDYAGAEQAAALGIGTRGPGSGRPGQYLAYLRGVRIQALAGQGRWIEAQAEVDALDADAAGDVATLRQIENLPARALIAVMSGHAAALLPRLRESLLEEEETMGADQLVTAFTRGLYAMALADAGDAAQGSRAAAELARATATLTAPSALGEAYADAGLRREIRRQILERFLHDATRADVDPATVASAFAVADFLRNSAVQRALADAAARSAASSDELADLVRRQQDMALELSDLHAFIAAQRAAGNGAQAAGVLTAALQRATELERGHAALRAQTAARFPDYDKLVHTPAPTPADVAGRLADDEAFVALLPATDAVYVWLVRRHGTRFHRAALGGQELEGLVKRLRATLDVASLGPHRMPAFDAAASRRLYDALLGPLAGGLHDARHWVLAPGGVLATLPMAVLLTSDEQQRKPAPWLIRDAALSQVPSAGAWMALGLYARARPADQAFAAWADPSFGAPASLAPTTPQPDYHRIPPLPDTRTEAMAIASSLGADAGADLFLGARATRESVLDVNRSGLLQHKRVLLFATHGLVPGDLPNLAQPALALAADGHELSDPLAPLLTLEDVIGLKLHADWVVLSACSTAAADGRGAEALSGLARGFFYAGSRSVMATQWAVESRSATELTTRTFRWFAEHPGSNKAEALRRAMLEVMAMPGFAHPAFWAPYILVGDGGP